MSFSAWGSALLAEATTLKDELHLVWLQGHRNLLCEVNCSDLVTMLQDVDRARLHSHDLMLLEVHVLLSKCWRTNLSWIHREGNYTADRLVKVGVTSSNLGLRVVASLSPELEFILLKDR